MTNAKKSLLLGPGRCPGGDAGERGGGQWDFPLGPQRSEYEGKENLKNILRAFRDNNWQKKQTLKVHTVAQSLCLPTQAGAGHGSACQKRKKNRWRHVWCVNVVVLFLYRGLWGDHDEPTVAHCAIISEWNATETLILCVYMGYDYETFPALCWKNILMLLWILSFGSVRSCWWCRRLRCNIWRRCVSVHETEKKRVLFCFQWAYVCVGQTHKFIFHVFASVFSFCHSCIYRSIYFSNIYYIRQP